MTPDSERRARLTLSFLANLADPVLGSALRTMSASSLLAATIGADADGEALLAGQQPEAAMTTSIERWRADWRHAQHRHARRLAGERIAAHPAWRSGVADAT